jgi:hypothetical protein
MTFPEDVRGSDSRSRSFAALSNSQIAAQRMSNSFAAITGLTEAPQQHRSPGPASDQGWQKQQSLACWKAVDQVFHLGGVHVKAADDHIVTATEMDEVTIGVRLADLPV